MAPIGKENDVLTLGPETGTAAPSPAVARPEDTSNRPQPVALEVPVTVNGARTAVGSDKREPFSEATKTVLVFGNGAVIRLASPVAAGQLLFLTNEKTKKEVVCQVVKSKNYRNVSGYVELEFTESVVGFWGMRFPSDRIAQPGITGSATAKSNSATPVPAAPKVVPPFVGVGTKAPEIKPVQSQAETKTALQAGPVGVKAVPPVTPKPDASPIQNVAASLPIDAKKPETPVVSEPAISSSLAFSVASLLSVPEVPEMFRPSSPQGPVVSFENKQDAASVGENSSKDLKLQAARLQDQLSSMLFEATPAQKRGSTPPEVSALDAATVSGVPAKVFEIAKSEPVAVKSAPLAEPVRFRDKSSLDAEELKIPSWLEPLARNASAPASTQELIEREKAKHAAELSVLEEQPVEPSVASAAESAPQLDLPSIPNLLPLDEEPFRQPAESGHSHRGIIFGAIAAAALLAAGGGWYLMHTANAAQRSAPAPVTHAAIPTSPDGAAVPVSQPAVQQASPQISEAASQTISGERGAPQTSKTPQTSSAPSSKLAGSPQPVPVTRDNARGSGTTIPAAVTERISRAVPEPEPKKPALGEVHLASPTVNRRASAQETGISAPTISANGMDANGEGIASGLAGGTAKQPEAPEVPLPVGGDVKPAKLLSKVDAIYPTLAKNQHVSGNVVMDALIDPSGRVTTMKIISGPTLLHQAAKDALRQWKYQPASLDGKPVAMHLTVTLQFRLQ